MNRISFEGFNNKYATFNAGAGVIAGAPVILNAEGKIVKATDGTPFFGICTSLRNGIATVQLQGYAEFQVDSDFEYGYTKLLCNAAGSVIAGEDSDKAPYVKVVKIDEDNQTVGFIF